MTKHERKISRLVACFMWGLAFFIALNAIAYIVPRSGVRIYSLETTEQEYETGDIITVRADFESSVKSQTTNSIYLKCGNNLYQLKQIVYETYPTDRGIVYTDVGLVPKDVFPPECVLQSKLAATTKILPWLHKTTVNVYQTNEFKVTNKGR